MTVKLEGPARLMPADLRRARGIEAPSRRSLVVGAAAVGAALVVGCDAGPNGPGTGVGDPAGATPAARRRQPPADVASLHALHFAGLVGERFVLTGDAGTMVVTLAEIEGLGAPYPGSPRAPFAVRFAAPARWGQGVYALLHPDVGQHELLFVPVDAGAPMLEAIFT
jgi:hypothetical protein